VNLPREAVIPRPTTPPHRRAPKPAGRRICRRPSEQASDAHLLRTSSHLDRKVSR